MAILNPNPWPISQNQVIANQMKRQKDEVLRLRESLETRAANEVRMESKLRDAQRQHADLESRMKEDLVMARIREAENIQAVAELTQKISSLEFKVNKNSLKNQKDRDLICEPFFQKQEKQTEGDLATSQTQSDKIKELQDQIANLRAKVS